MLTLYGYWRSTAVWRVRIVLNLKQLEYLQEAVHLLRDGGEQCHAAYRAMNPQGLVPLLVDGEQRIAQSLAIIEYLEETHPEPALLPRDAGARARIRSWSQFIVSEIHPLNNLRVLQYLGGELSLDETSRNCWYQHWVAEGLTALEKQVQQHLPIRQGGFSLGDRPGYFEACLVPQLYNARRFECPLDAYPTLVALNKRCQSLAAFSKAVPDAQPDAERS